MWVSKSCEPATEAELLVKRRASWVVMILMVIGGVWMGWYLTQQQSRVREAEAKYQLAIEGSAQGLWYWDVTIPGKFVPTDRVWYSDRYLEMLGETRETFPPVLDSFMSRVHPEDLAGVEAVVADYFAGELDIAEATCRVRHSDGGYRWLFQRGATDESQEHMAGSTIDLTAEIEQQRRAERIVQSAGIAMIMCGPSREVTIYNAQAQELLGWSPDEALGMQIGELIPESYRTEHDTKFQAAIDRLLSLDGNYVASRSRVPTTALHKDGSKVPILLSVRGIKYGNQIEFVATFRPQVTDVPVLPPAPPPEVRPFELPQRAVQYRAKK